MSGHEFLPYGRQAIDDEDIRHVVRILKSDFLTTGPEISAFEREIREYTGARYALAVSNGTAALHLAVLALKLPLGSVGVTHPNTFVATSNALIYCGHKPGFVDIDQSTLVMDPLKLDEAMKKTRARVVLPVHFAGNPAGVEEVSDIARNHGAYIIEDAAHSVGGAYRDGSKVGSCSYSDMTTFSFHPVKTMTTGEGGAITTNNEDLYKRLLMLRTHGITKDASQLHQNPGPWYYEMQMLGYNYRMTDIQAALGRSQLRKLDRFVERRRELVNRYNEAFVDLSFITTPVEAAGYRTAWHLYAARFDFERLGKSRPEVMAELYDRQIGSQVLYIPVHTQPYYREHYGYRFGDFPNAECYYDQALALPLYPAMTDADQVRVINAVHAVVKDRQ